MKNNKTKIVQRGADQIVVVADRDQFNLAVAQLATFLGGSPDRMIGGVTMSDARDALEVVTGFTSDQLGSISSARVVRPS